MSNLAFSKVLVACMLIASSTCAGASNLVPRTRLRRRLQADYRRGNRVAASIEYFIVAENANTSFPIDKNQVVAAQVFSAKTHTLLANCSLTASKAKDYLNNITVAVDDTNVAVVGSPNYEDGGIVVVYSVEDESSGKWKLLQELKPPSGSKAKFGNSIDISGSRIIVGDGEDKAFIFSRKGNGKFELATTLTGDGGKVAILDDTVVVTYKKVTGGPMLSVYQFSSSSAKWTEVSSLDCPDCTSQQDYGGDLSLSDNRLVVSTNTVNNTRTTGYVYVVDKHDGDNWIINATITSGLSNDNFGEAIAVSGMCLLIGAPLPSNPGGSYGYYTYYWSKWTFMTGAYVLGGVVAEFVALTGNGEEYPYASYMSDPRFGQVNGISLGGCPLQ